jgi:Uncharacterised protein family UPF0547
VEQAGEYKRCPDCAEEVLSAARKCRFCGYRFDTGRREGPSDGGVFARLTRRPPVASLPELLADWGVSLGTSEKVISFLLVDLDGEPRFMLVSSERIVFARIESPGDVLEYQRADLVSVARRRRRLELRGLGFDHLVSGLSAAEIALLADRLVSPGK